MSKKDNKYGRINLNVEDTYKDLMDLDPFERAILREVRKKHESRK